MIRSVALIVVWLATVAAWAQPMIEAPLQVPVGNGLVRVYVRGAPEGHGILWFCTPDDLDTESFGNKLVFAAGCAPRRIVINAIVGSTFADATKLRAVIVVVASGPGPGPDPGPDPTPGPRRVVVVSETGTDTPAQTIATNALREWVLQRGHQWNLVDPDQAAYSPRVRQYLDFLGKQNLLPPAIVVIATDNGKDVGKAVAFPRAGTTGQDGVAAGRAAIAEVQKLGG